MVSFLKISGWEKMVWFCTRDHSNLLCILVICRILRLGLQSIRAITEWMNRPTCSCAYLLGVVLERSERPNSAVRGRGFSAKSLCPRRRSEIEGDARSRYLLPCEIGRRVRCFWIFLARDSQSPCNPSRWEGYPLSFGKTTPPLCRDYCMYCYSSWPGSSLSQYYDS